MAQQSPDLSRAAVESMNHSIVSFLQRPYVVNHFTWLDTATPASQLFSNNFPEDLLAQTAIREKIAGSTYFRADLVVKVQVNAQPFQQGRLIIAFIPYYAGRSDGAGMSLSNLTSISGYPHVDLDLLNTQVMEIRIPYIAPIERLGVVNQAFNIGSVIGFVYGQLHSGNVEGTVWAHFENVDVSIPTGVNPFAFEPSSAFVVKRPGKLNMRAQSATEAEAAVPMGPISRIAKVAENIAVAGKNMPLLSEIAGPAASVARAIGDLASLFGMSKPTTEAVPNIVQLQTPRYYNNSNGVDYSKKLALDALNSINTGPVFGSKLDEMSLAYIAKTPCYYDSFEWNTTNAADTFLWNDAVAPITQVGLDNTAHTITSTHLAYVARPFRLWRGSIKYKFKFVMTKFHSGRLRVFFLPAVFDENGNPRPFDHSKCHTEVFDLSEKSEFEITVPFVFGQPWCEVFTENTGAGAFPPNTGAIVIQVVNELVASSTVSNNIHVMIEKSGGPDIAFACPREVLFRPISTPSLTVASKKSSLLKLDAAEAGTTAEKLALSLDSEGGLKTTSTLKLGDNLSLKIGDPPDQVDERRAARGDEPIRALPEGVAPSKEWIIAVTSINYNSLVMAGVPLAEAKIEAQILTENGTIVRRQVDGTMLWSGVDPPPDMVVKIVADWKKDPVRKERSVYRMVGQIGTREDCQIACEETINLVPMAPLLDQEATFNTVGEEVGSIKQLLNRFQLFGTCNEGIPKLLNTTVFPWAPYRAVQLGTQIGLGCDYFTYFSALYAYMRGGVRIKLQPTVSSPNDTVYARLRIPTYLDVSNQTAPQPSSVDQTSAVSPFRGTVVGNFNHEAMFEFEVPFYSRYPFVTSTFVGTPAFNSPYIYSSHLPDVRIQTEGVFGPMRLHRAVADDFQFGFLVGPPVLYLPP